MMIAGQIQGGYAQGLGGSLYEEFRYSANGAPLSVTFADYLMPTSCEVVPVDILVLEDAPSPLNPLGLKGAGEAGVTAVGAALAAAVDDALQMPGAITELPITPQRVLALLKAR
jgi:carbon-monoxide dehydrogenase large subunit/6-hydroxypseudooxynicotine dehydrogenase subunit gamma